MYYIYRAIAMDFKLQKEAGTPCVECCRYSNCSRTLYSVHRKKALQGRIKNHHDAVGKQSSEQQFH